MVAVLAPMVDIAGLSCVCPMALGYRSPPLVVISSVAACSVCLSREAGSAAALQHGPSEALHDEMALRDCLATVQVVSLKKKPQSEGSSFQAMAAAPQVHPHLTSAAMRAQAQAAQPLPTAKVDTLQRICCQLTICPMRPA